jgi:hypothetical protein
VNLVLNFRALTSAPGLANDQVISSTPGAPRTDFTRSDAGPGRDGSSAKASQAGANLSRTTCRKLAACSGASRR